ncbi:MAG: class GN sortase [Neomegalonema sp.]
MIRRATMMRGKALAIAALAVAGVGITASARWIPAKAALGQHLLESAWQRAQAGAGDSRPWAWADIRPIARLHAPRLGQSQIVLDQASGEAMAWGPGYVQGTAPLGAPGLSAAAAHRDTHFAFLKDLEIGDVLELETADGRRLKYQVRESRVVDSRLWTFPIDRDGPDVLAVATCWPFDVLEPGPERFILFADRI